MNLKEINFKKMFIEKGERIGLVICLAITGLLVVIFGLASATGGPGAGANEEKIVDLRKQAQRALESSTPPPEKGFLPEDLKTVDLKTVEADWFPTHQPLFHQFPREDRKWRKPEILAVDEFDVHLVRGAIQVYNLGVDKGKVMVQVLNAKTSGKDGDVDPKKRQQLLQDLNRAIRRNSRRPAVRPPPSAPAGGGEGMLGMGGAGLPGIGGPGTTAKPGDNEMESKWVSADQLGKDANQIIAETNLPVRMVMVTGAFPYKEQLEKFRLALRQGSIDDLFADKASTPQFAGFNVQRRVSKLDGSVVQEWADYDVDTPMKRLRIQTKEVDWDDPQLAAAGLILSPNSLVMSRPKLARDQKYPDFKLKGILDTVEEMQKALEGNAPPPKKIKGRFDLDEADNYDDPNRPASAGGEGAPPEGAPAGGGKPGLGGEGGGQGTLVQKGATHPTKILVRFLDVDIKPGLTYEYKIQMKMFNPNFEQPDRAVHKDYTKDKYIDGPWQEVTWTEGDKKTSKIAVADELQYYVMDDPKPGEGKRVEPATVDKVPVQIHRWVDWVKPRPNQKEGALPVGDWTVLERRLVHRGEYLGKFEEVEVPYWNPNLNNWALAVHPDDQVARKNGRIAYRRHKGIPIDFASDPLSEEKTLVVDFEGGTRFYPPPSPGRPQVKETAPLEMLILTPEGKLIVRNSHTDTANAERKTRFDAWAKWLADVDNFVKGNSGPKADDPFNRKSGGKGSAPPG